MTDSREDLIVNKLKEIEQKLTGLVEINARLTKEIINIKNNNTETNNFVAQNEPPTKPTNVVVHIDLENIKIYGNTYKHRSLFNNLGGSWNGTHKHWELIHDKKDNLLEVLESESVEYEVRTQ